jgi:hypothetical protein
MTRSPRIAGRLLPATLLSLALGFAALPAPPPSGSTRSSRTAA